MNADKRPPVDVFPWSRLSSTRADGRKKGLSRKPLEGRLAYWVMAVVGAFGLFAGGCHKPVIPDDLGPAPLEATGETPSYTQLVKRYNDNVRALDRVWTSTEVHVRWENEDGKQRSEHGDGHLIMARPRKVALTVGKLGNTILWAGSNEHGYWLFDTRDEGTVFYGRYENLNKPCSRSLPVPV
jgi:hypothetical protein